MEDRNDHEMLPTRLNKEPPVFRGCSISELITLTGIAAVILVPACVMVLAVLGYAMMGVGIGMLATIGGVVAGATQLQKMKRGRPLGYYPLQIALMLDNLGIKKIGVIRSSGYWSIGRTENAAISRKLQK